MKDNSLGKVAFKLIDKKKPIYRVNKKSMCTWRLQYKHHVH